MRHQESRVRTMTVVGAIIGIALVSLKGCAQVFATECSHNNGTYGGTVTAIYPDHTSHETGLLFGFIDGPIFTNYTFRNAPYQVQHPNIIRVSLYGLSCGFELIYLADPIFRGDFENNYSFIIFPD